MTDMTNVPPAPTASVKYAGFWVRYVAYVVDILIIFIPMLVVAFGADFVFGLDYQSLSGRLVGEIFEYLVIWTYFVFMTYGVGATLGKMLVGIHVQSESFQKLSLGRIIIRETIGKLVSGLIILVGYIIAGFTSKKQALHDKFAHSVVVYKNPSKVFGPGLIVGIIISTILPVIAFVGILSSIVLVSLSDARMKAEAAQTQEIQANQQYQNEIQNSNQIDSQFPTN